jgi:AAA domain
VIAGANVVVRGPPGTGKSQTIANLVASLAARSQRTLFVAEKRAAIDAVVKRLDKVGLAGLIMDLHRRSGSRRLVAKDLRRSLDGAARSTPLPVPDASHGTLEARRATLRDYATSLHEKRSPWGVSLFDAQEGLLGAPEHAQTDYRFDTRTLKRLTGDTIRVAHETLRQFTGIGGLPTGSDHPWADAAITTPARAEEAMTTASQLSRQTLPQSVAALHRLADECSLRGPSTVDDGAELLATLEGAAAAVTLFSDEAFAQDLDALAARINRPGLGGLVSSEARRARRLAMSLLRDRHSRLRRQALSHALVRAGRARAAWMALGGASTPSVSPADLISARDAWRELERDVETLNTFVPSRQLRKLQLPDLHELLQAMLADRMTLNRLPEAHRLWEVLGTLGLWPFMTEARCNGVPAPDVTASLQYCWFASIYEAELGRDPRAGAIDAGYHSRTVTEFREADAQHIAQTPERIKRLLAERIIQARDQFPGQSDLVAREAGKKRGHIPLRQLFRDAPDVIGALKPCWVMSPLEVSQLLPGDRPYFDVVIFDEASQITPADAIPAILRGHQLVVAGDRQQLPPTSFFRSTSIDDDEGTDEYEDAPEDGAANFESILDVIETFVPFRALGWHYRSRDERLIAFSNVHFYDRSLTTFPGVLGEGCLRSVRVPAPARGLDANQSAQGEVRAVVEEVVEHLRTRPDESLGVIALGIQHADRISEALRLARLADPSLEPFFSDDREESLFVKNLERVQGDERDAIILSVGYGKRNADGRLSYHFGPILQESGERRLNVAITRARNRMTTVSSFGAEDMDPARTTRRGVDLLRRYLQYVASGGDDLGDGPREHPQLNPFEISIRARQALKPTAHGGRLERGSVGVGEDEVVLRQADAELEAFLGLTDPVRPQGNDCLGRKRDESPRPRRLGI